MKGTKEDFQTLISVPPQRRFVPTTKGKRVTRTSNGSSDSSNGSSAYNLTKIGTT